MRFCFLAATFALSVLCWTAPAAAQPYPDVVWNSMIDQVVHIELGNGLELTGTLIGHEGGQAVVAKANGSIVTLDTAEVAALRLVSGPSSGPPVAEQRPAPPSEDRGRAPDPVPPALSAGSETQLRLVASFEELYPPQSGLFEDIEEVEEWIVAAPLLGEEKNELERLLASYVENGRARIGLQLGGMGIALGGIAPVIYCAVQIGEEAGDDPYTEGYEFFCGLGMGLIIGGAITSTFRRHKERAQRSRVGEMRAVVAQSQAVRSIAPGPRLALHVSPTSLALSGRF